MKGTELDARREEQLRIQALGAALSRREWGEVEQAYNRIRDEFDRRPTDARLEAVEIEKPKAVADAAMAEARQRLKSFARGRPMVYEGQPFDKDKRLKEDVRSVLAALSRTPGEAVQVKPLEWRWIGHMDGGQYDAACSIGRYKVWGAKFSGWQWSTYLGRSDLKSYLSADEAKAAAQADYEARVRSALIPVPAAPAGEIEALEAAALSRTPGEAVAWLQENPMFGKELVFDAHLTAGDKANGWTETPLYAHPAPAAPAGEIEALEAALAKAGQERDEARELCYSMRSNDEEIRKAVERSGFASDTWIVHALDQSSDRADGWEARALAAEAALAKAVKALKEIEDHPENSSGTSRSYGIGWAFWNVQNIARRARTATPDTKEDGL